MYLNILMMKVTTLFASLVKSISNNRTIQILFFASCFVAFNNKSFAQEYNYTFQVEAVDDIASAKEMTDYIRPLFNSVEKPFGYFPWYNATSKSFVFKSAILVSEAELKNTLQTQGLLLLNFNREIAINVNSSEQ